MERGKGRQEARGERRKERGKRQDERGERGEIAAQVELLAGIETPDAVTFDGA